MRDPFFDTSDDDNEKPRVNLPKVNIELPPIRKEEEIMDEVIERDVETEEVWITEEEIVEEEEIIEEEIIEEKKGKKKSKKTKKTKQSKKTKKTKASKSSKDLVFTRSQRIIATVIYIALVGAILVTIVGCVWAVFDIFMSTGKLVAFLALSFGYQMAIIGSFLAGFFFLLIVFFGLSKKGVKVITKITFQPRIIEEKYQNKAIIKIFSGAIMLSIFAIIIGILVSIVMDLVLGSSSDGSITNIFAAFDSTGTFVLFLGILLLVLVGLSFSLNWLWYNGYYFLLRIATSIESED